MINVLLIIQRLNSI